MPTKNITIQKWWARNFVSLPTLQNYQSGNLGGGDQKPTPQQTTEGASKPQYATPSTGGLTPSMGVASSDKDSSTTYSAVSNGTFEIRSGGTSDVSRDTSNANHPLENKFDLTKVEEQQELARVFGEEGFRVAGDFAEYMGWKNGSLEKIMLHSVVGGMQAGLGGGNIFAGAAGAGVSEAAYGKGIGGEWTSIAIGAGIGAITGSYQTGAATAQEGYLFNDLIHENTDDVLGLHQRLVVRDREGNLIYGFSFGWNSFVGGNPIFSNSSASGAEPNPGKNGNGIIYTDDDVPLTKVTNVFQTSSEEDSFIIEYMKSRINETAPYNLFTNSCRTFTGSEYNKIKNEILRARNERRSPKF